MELETLLVLGLASSTVSVTLGSSRLFKLLRGWVAARSAWAGELIACAYCLGHWVSGVLVLLWAGALADLTAGAAAVAVRLVTEWLAVTALSALIAGTITLLFTAGSDERAES